MDNTDLLITGICVFILLFTGLGITIMEFRAQLKEREKLEQNNSDESS